MCKSFVPISDFRDQIDFTFDAINSHWQACVSEQERVQWFVYAIRRFNSLSQIDCKRAKPSDRHSYECVFDLFANHCEKHFVIWLKARLQSGSISKAQYQAVVLCDNNASVLHSTH